jgi:lysophospholipase L1-like esterase
MTWCAAGVRPHWWPMASHEPNVRYYDTRTPPRRWAATGALAAVIVVLAAAITWVATDGFGRDQGTATGQVGTGGLPSGEAGSGAGDGAAIGDGGSAGLGVATDATSVVMVGDSITQGSADEIRFTLAAGGFTDVTVDGVTSRRIEAGGGQSPESGIEAIYRLLADGADPDVWVIALGTNDIGKYATSEEYGALVALVVDVLPDDTPLVWVDAYRDDYVDDSALFNDALRAQLSDRDGTVVVDWSDVVSQDGSILRDGVHPDRDGEALFASLVAQGLDQLR